MRRRLSPRIGLVAVALMCAALLATTPAATAAQAGDHHRAYKKVGYFIQWGIYGRGFFVKNLATSGAAAKLTHVNYAFANVSEDGRCFEANVAGEGDAWADYQRPASAAESVDGVADSPDQALKGNFNQLRKLKARYPDLKVLLSIGGWTWSTFFSNAALTSASRKAFVASCIDLLSRATCRSSARSRAVPALRPACSTASTLTGSGPPRKASPATWSGRRTGATSPCCWPSSAGSSTRTAARPAVTTS